MYAIKKEHTKQTNKAPRENKSRHTDIETPHKKTSTNITNNKQIYEIINNVLTSKFSNGFRYKSDIEISRLRRMVNESFASEITLSEDEIIQYIRNRSIEFDGKYYFVSAETKANIAKWVNNYFHNGGVIIFYEAFYEKHEQWLIERSIVSHQMIKTILEIQFPKLYFTSKYCGNKYNYIDTILKQNIEKVWGENTLMSYTNLSELLPYVPLNRMRKTITDSDDFIYNSKENFTHVSKIRLTKDDKVRITSWVENEVNKHGYATFVDAPMQHIADENFELSQTALYRGIFLKCLKDRYEQRGKIITSKGNALRLIDILIEYCQSRDQCTLKELLDIAYDLTGQVNRWSPLQSAYDTMVRTDVTYFVAEHLVSFDVPQIDKEIERYLGNSDYIPLHSVVTFAMFPYCEQGWNLYLLGSYCYRFSSLFRFEKLAWNDSNAGVIVRKTCHLSYIEIMADAVAHSKVELTDKMVNAFLYDNGYIAQKTYKSIDELIRQAKDIRNKLSDKKW